MRYNDENQVFPGKAFKCKVTKVCLCWGGAFWAKNPQVDKENRPRLVYHLKTKPVYDNFLILAFFLDCYIKDMYFNASTLARFLKTPSALDCQFRCKENSKCFFFSYTAGHNNLGKSNLMIYSSFFHITLLLWLGTGVCNLFGQDTSTMLFKKGYISGRRIGCVDYTNRFETISVWKK